MNIHCPYCLISDVYYQAGFSGNVSDEYFNKCINCNKWSMYKNGQGQLTLPVEFTDEYFENKL